MKNSHADKERQRELKEEQILQNKSNGSKDQFKQTANLEEEGYNIAKNKEIGKTIASDKFRHGRWFLVLLNSRHDCQAL